MKKLYSFLLAIPMFVAIANSQVLDGSDCSHAKEIPNIPDSCAVNEHQMNAGDYEQWHHVKPTQPEMHFKIEPPQTQPEAHIHKASLIKGGCGGMQTIEQKNISFNEALEITRTDLVPNEDYYIKIERDSNCAQCNAQGGTFYGLCVARQPLITELAICGNYNGSFCCSNQNNLCCSENAGSICTLYKICVGEEVTLTVDGDFAYQFCATGGASDYPNACLEWNVGGLQVTAAPANLCSPICSNLNSSITVQSPTAGVFQIELILRDAPGSSNILQSEITRLKVLDVPNLSFSFVTSPPYCTGDEICVQSTGSTDDLFFQYFDYIDGFITVNSPQGSPLKTYACGVFNDIGTKTISLTASNQCGTSVFSQNIAYGPSFVDFTFSGLCLGSPTNFTAFADCQEDIGGWSWNFGDGSASNLQNPSHTYANPGSYVVTLTINGTLSVTHTVVISNAIVANAGPDETICGGTVFLGSGTFLNPTTATGGVSPYAYNWSVSPSGGQLNSTNNSIVFFTYSGPTKTFTATVTVTDANGCTKTDQKVFTIKTAGDCCSDAYSYTYRSITINNNTTANYINGNGNSGTIAVGALLNIGTGTFSVRDAITVNAPASINIFNRTIKFGAQGRLIVKKGAAAVIDNSSVLTAIECSTVMWQGIFVEGNPTASQFPTTNQGSLTIKGNSTIRDAHIGIRNFITAGIFHGGIIKAYDAKLINNRYAVMLFPYKDLGWGEMIFKNCLYETTAPMKDDIAYKTNASHAAFIWMWDQFYKVRLSIESNTFRLTAPSILNSGNLVDRGMGIISYDSQYYVQKAAGAKGGNVFQNLRTGIDINRGINNNSDNFVWVRDKNNFQDNFTGIMQTGTNGTSGIVKIENNTFTQTNYTSPFQIPNKIGIYNNGIGKIDIFNNTFTKHSIGIFSNNSTGANLSSTQYNNAWKNIFTNCGRGLEFKNNNSRFQVLCNTFNNGLNNAQAYWVVNNGNVKNPQGGYSNNTCTFADNTFGSPLPPSKHINLVWQTGILDPSFTYYYNGTAPAVNTSGCIVGPCSMQVTTCSGSKVSACNSQPQKVGGGSPQQIAQQLSTATNQQQRMVLIQEMISALVDNDKIDSIIPFLESIPDTEAKWMLVPEYIGAKRFTDAETVLNNLQKDNLERQKKDDYYKVHIELGKTDRIPTDMTVVEKSTVGQVALTETEISYNAKAMLHFWFNEKYEPELAMLGSNRMAAPDVETVENSAIIALDDKENKVSSIYPNPNDGTMWMDYELKKGQKGNLVIYDMTGRIVRQYILNIENKNLQIELMAGIYFYNVNVNGEIAISDKLVIIK